MSDTEKNVLCFCVDESDSNDVPRASLVAIVKGTSTVVWCDVMGGNDASNMISPAATAIANSLLFRLVKTPICTTHWSEHALSVGHVKSFYNISLLLKDADYLKKCLEHVKKVANTNGKDVTSSDNVADSAPVAPIIHSGANKAAQGTGAEASSDAANLAVKHDGSVHATAAATAAADQAGRRSSRPGGFVAAAAQGTGAEASSDAANVAVKHDASVDATAAATSAADEAGRRSTLDANTIRKNVWSPEIAARCLPNFLVNLNSSTTTEFPVFLIQPNKASWLKPKQCSGVAVSMPILSDYFQRDFRKILKDYVTGCKGKDRGGSVDDVIVFEPSQTDENKGKWRWEFAGDINYTSFDGSNRDTFRHSELKRLKWGQVEHPKDFLAFLDFTARYGCIASGIAEDGAPLKHGRMQSVFWDRTEINLHRAGAQRHIKTNEGHFVVHFVIGENCDIKFTLGHSSKQKAKLEFKAGSLCVVSGKTRFSGTQEIKCPTRPPGH